MKFVYPLSSDQYHRFVDDPNTTAEIDNLGRIMGVKVVDGDDPRKSWKFTGTCEGTAVILYYGATYYIVIMIDKSPWYIPRFVYDWGFKRALK